LPWGQPLTTIGKRGRFVGAPVNGHLAELLDLWRTRGIDEECYRETGAGGEQRNECLVISFEPAANYCVSHLIIFPFGKVLRWIVLMNECSSGGAKKHTNSDKARLW
jgi:hypothetical protein